MVYTAIFQDDGGQFTYDIYERRRFVSGVSDLSFIAETYKCQDCVKNHKRY